MRKIEVEVGEEKYFGHVPLFFKNQIEFAKFLKFLSGRLKGHYIFLNGESLLEVKIKGIKLQTVVCGFMVADHGIADINIIIFSNRLINSVDLDLYIATCMLLPQGGEICFLVNEKKFKEIKPYIETPKP